MGESALHEPAVSVPVAQLRAASSEARAASRSGVAVRLELPGRNGTAFDPGRLARAVEDLIQAIDPSLAGARVEVEVTLPSDLAGQPVASPSWTTDPSSPGVFRPLRAHGSPPMRATAGEDPIQHLDHIVPNDQRSGRTGDLELDLARRTLSVDGQAVDLTRREFELLSYLQDHRGVALSRQELMSAVWRNGSRDVGRTIDVHVRRLRIKLGRHAGRLGTLRGYGYRLD